MTSYKIIRHTSLSQPNIFQISTDIENFSNLMPNYFKSLEIVEKIGNQLIVFEKINFMGFNLKIKTKHVILKPNIHKIYILSGPTKGTEFVETYTASKHGTDILIEVNLELNGLLKIFRFLEGKIIKKMNSVTDEFISSAENYYFRNICQ